MAGEYAANTGRNYIRMDTGSGNDKLNNYYVSCGFNYHGIIAAAASDGLPAHDKESTLGLFSGISDELKSNLSPLLNSSQDSLMRLSRFGNLRLVWRYLL